MGKALQKDKKPIVSSAHLVSDKAVELSEFEYGLIIASHAFERWVIRCMGAAGFSDLNALDVLVVHTVNHRGREKKLADICFTLNVEDAHLVNYSLKKLTKLKLVSPTRSGKESLYSTTKSGEELCTRYKEVRDNCLLNTMNALGNIENQEVSHLASTLRALSGLYDQAARAATSL